MVLHKSAVWCLLLAASAVYCHPEDDDSDDKFQCHGDGGRLDRGGQQLIFSPNANVSCDSVVFSPVGNDSAASALSSLPKGSIPIVGGNVRCSEWPMQYISLPSNITEDRVRITWNCPGDVVYCRIVNIVDPASTTTTIPSIVVSQTCSLTSKSPLGSCASPMHPLGSSYHRILTGIIRHRRLNSPDGHIPDWQCSCRRYNRRNSGNHRRCCPN